MRDSEGILMDKSQKEGLRFNFSSPLNSLLRWRSSDCSEHSRLQTRLKRISDQRQLVAKLVSNPSGLVRNKASGRPKSCRGLGGLFNTKPVSEKGSHARSNRLSRIQVHGPLRALPLPNSFLGESLGFADEIREMCQNRGPGASKIGN